MLLLCGAVSLPPGAEAHAQPLGLLPLLALQVLKLLLLHLSVDLQLFVSQTHGGHAKTATTSDVSSNELINRCEIKQRFLVRRVGVRKGVCRVLTWTPRLASWPQ